jgi:biotin carboxylase
VARDGEALGVFCGRKLLQDPSAIGTARVAEARWVDEVVEQGLALLRGLGFHGASQVEFKRDPRDGEYKLMEVNPRLWRWHSLAAACGVNLAYIAYCDVAGEPLPRAQMSPNARTRWAVTLKADRRPVPPAAVRRSAVAVGRSAPRARASQPARASAAESTSTAMRRAAPSAASSARTDVEPVAIT